MALARFEIHRYSVVRIYSKMSILRGDDKH